MTSTWGSRRSWGMKRSRRTLGGRPRRSGAGSGPPVVATTSTSSPASARVVSSRRRPRSALSSVPWVTCTTGRPPRARPPRRRLEGRRGGREDRPDEAHRGCQVRAGVLEAGHCGLQVGVHHLGLQVDQIAVEAAARRPRPGAGGRSAGCRPARGAGSPSSWPRCAPGAAGRCRAGTPPPNGAASRLFEA